MNKPTETTRHMAAANTAISETITGSQNKNNIMPAKYQQHVPQAVMNARQQTS